LTAVERLAAHASALPADFGRALGEDLEYGRFGAALAELPQFGGWAMGLNQLVLFPKRTRFSTLFREAAPVSFGLKAAELVANGALVGTEAGLAFVAGWFTQVCVARALEPLERALSMRHHGVDETVEAARLRIEWVQSLFLMQELHGNELLGSPLVRSKLQLRKANTPKGIGRGLYELIRVASQEALEEAPSKSTVDGWMRGLFVFSLAVGTPAGRLKALHESSRPELRELYRSSGVDVWPAVEAGLQNTRAVLAALSSMIRRGNFSSRAKARVLALIADKSDEVTASGKHSRGGEVTDGSPPSA
jgi:hypothetical protein